MLKIILKIGFSSNYADFVTNSIVHTMNIPIVVAAYDRGFSLERLLSSLVKAKYEHTVKLIISIDGGGTVEVQECAERFDWPHGEKSNCT